MATVGVKGLSQLL